jgi:hypothetical protein
MRSGFTTNAFLPFRLRTSGVSDICGKAQAAQLRRLIGYY